MENVREIFLSPDIRMLGTPDDPLFLVPEIARKIGDTHYRRVVNNYSDDFVTRRPPPCPLIFTEMGLYKYLLASKRVEAEPFQRWVYDQLKQLRKTMVTDAELKVKLAEDRASLAEDLANIALAEAKVLRKKARVFSGVVIGTCNIIPPYDKGIPGNCPLGQADQAIARYILEEIRATNVVPFTSSDVPRDTYMVLANMAQNGWDSEPYKSYELKAFRILDQVPRSAGTCYKLDAKKRPYTVFNWDLRHRTPN